MSSEESQTIDYDLVVQAAFDKLLSDYLASNHRKRTEPIEKAYRLARSAHHGVKRRSGQPYILHPIAVASIVCNEIGLGSTSITAALLHDVVEDTDYTVADIRDMFGESVARIVSGLTKLSGEILVEAMTETNNTSGQLENIRRLLVTSTKDIRILLVKIADRLHNMRTLESMPATKQSKIAAETRLFYAPLAERLGMYVIMEELEDLSLKYTHPEEYREVHAKIAGTHAKREGLFDRVYKIIKPDLDATGLTYEIQHRIKSTSSIWKKMQRKGLPFEEIYDVFAIRIIFDPATDSSEYSDCFRIYHVLTSHFALKDDRTRDWLTRPKPNGYRALHITVMGPTGEWVEVQIRSRKMHEMAERGLAAHWRYKSRTSEIDSDEEQILNNVHTLLNNPGPDASDDYETMVYKFANQDMLIFTSKGDRMRCPQDFTVLDFAYQLDPEQGNHCIGAKVNHEMVPVSHQLQNGDQVEILTTANTEPKEEWLDIATSPTTKRYIHDYLREEKRKQVEEGRRSFDRFARQSGYAPEQLLPENPKAPLLSYATTEQFFLAISRYELQPDHELLRQMEKAHRETSHHDHTADVVEQREDSDETKVPAIPPESMRQVYHLTANDGIRNYIRATCCRPVRGEEVHAIINKYRQPVVHLNSCPKAMRLKATYGDDIVEVKWGSHVHSNFGITIEFSGSDSPDFLDRLMAIVRGMHIPVVGIHVDSIRGMAVGSIHVRVRDREERDRMMRRMQEALGLLQIRQIHPDYSEQRRGMPVPNQEPFIPDPMSSNSKKK